MFITIYFLLFLIYAGIGWLIKVVTAFIEERKFINRGFLLGPYCPIYGCGTLAITFLLEPYQNEPVILFIMSMVIFSIIEYSTSWLMEKIFNARWWDYSQMKFNLNGRICLETMIPFGLGGLITVYFLNPFFSHWLLSIPQNFLNLAAFIFALAFIIDLIISFNIIIKIKNRFHKLAQDSTQEITSFIQIQFKKKSRLIRRIFDAFPQLSAKINFKKNKIT